MVTVDGLGRLRDGNPSPCGGHARDANVRLSVRPVSLSPTARAIRPKARAQAGYPAVLAERPFVTGRVRRRGFRVPLLSCTRSGGAFTVAEIKTSRVCFRDVDRTRVTVRGSVRGRHRPTPIPREYG